MAFGENVACPQNSLLLVVLLEGRDDARNRLGPLLVPEVVEPFMNARCILAVWAAGQGASPEMMAGAVRASNEEEPRAARRRGDLWAKECLVEIVWEEAHVLLRSYP